MSSGATGGEYDCTAVVLTTLDSTCWPLLLIFNPHTFITFSAAVVTRANVSITSKMTSEIKNVVELMNISLPWYLHKCWKTWVRTARDMSLPSLERANGVVEIDLSFLSRHRNRTNFRLEIEIDLISVLTSKWTWWLASCVGGPNWQGFVSGHRNGHNLGVVI